MYKYNTVQLDSLIQVTTCVSILHFYLQLQHRKPKPNWPFLPTSQDVRYQAASWDQPSLRESRTEGRHLRWPRQDETTDQSPVLTSDGYFQGHEDLCAITFLPLRLIFSSEFRSLNNALAVDPVLRCHATTASMPVTDSAPGRLKHFRHSC